MRRSLTERLDAIPPRVRALSARDPHRSVFGAEAPGGHDYRLVPPVSEEALAAFELRERVRLPAAYRAFLTRVSNGGAGPAYGLLPLAQALEHRRSIRAPFPYGTRDAQRVMKDRVSGREPYAFVGDDDDAPGILTLCDNGCAWYTFLVVSGEQRGKVWVGGELGFCPEYFLRAGKPVQHTFLSWYEDWLRGSWRATRVKAFKPPRGKRFNLNGKLVGALPDALFECAHVEELSLSANKLDSVPEAIGKLQNLRTLDLGGNLLETLPAAIGDLPKLEELHVAHNLLSELPVSIGELACLRVLSVQNNPIKELPASMASLHALRRLLLGDTDLKRLPPWLHTLALEELQLNGVVLDDWNDLRGNGTLKTLWLSMNPELAQIPDAVFTIASLEHLVLGATSIAELPPDIGRLRNLRSIGLANTLVSPDELERARARWPHLRIS